MLGLYFFFKGYVTAEIKGALNEKIINKAIRSGIFMWNIKSGKDGLCVNIRNCDRELFLDAAGDAEVIFTTKVGLPFIVERFKKRYALVFGVLIFTIVTAFLSSLVWSINITGCEKTAPSDIMNILEQRGIHKWSFKRAVNEDKLKLYIMNSLDTVSWIGIELKGTALNIEIKERTAIPYIVDNRAVDIVASKDGVIKYMSIRSGEKMVAPGDTVIRGQVLVSALVERDGENLLEHPYTVHSYGDVIARTWYTYNIKQHLYTEKKEYTGREYSEYSLNLLGNEINLDFKKNVLFEEYEKIVKKSGGFIGINSTVYRETKTTKTPVDINSSLELAVLKAEKQLPDEILTFECLTKNYTDCGDFINAEIVFECTENIAVEVPHTKRREATNDSKDNQIQ